MRKPALVMLVLALAACGASQRRDAIKTTVVALNAAVDGFATWDDQHQTEIVAKAEKGILTKDETKRALEDYRKQRENVVKAIVIAYRAIAVASTQTDGLSLDKALAEALKLYDAIKAVKQLQGGP